MSRDGSKDEQGFRAVTEGPVLAGSGRCVGVGVCGGVGV